MHYRRFMKHGDPLVKLRPKGPGFSGSNHPRWKDRDITYHTAHRRVFSARGKANAYMCECGVQAQEWSYDHSDPNPLLGKSRNSVVLYSPDVDRYKPMCGPCHRKLDRLAGLASA